eukprot:gnl/TRDRNA2_/TRDRNA2_45053_c0_seq1.p2 gnl/TRDRNA2_/TRDRNA2_45053_c0~~gnl/TRDRNA2_/TRDRNA2_45053_c0_seq1.p2  ORF type:complete len:141 (-),score=18.97 gnl/TRDRNA2_/TRDRNA2_45053_c0_seq1:3-425(-)
MERLPKMYEVNHRMIIKRVAEEQGVRVLTKSGIPMPDINSEQSCQKCQIRTISPRCEHRIDISPGCPWNRRSFHMRENTIDYILDACCTNNDSTWPASTPVLQYALENFHGKRILFLVSTRMAWDGSCHPCTWSLEKKKA